MKKTEKTLDIDGSKLTLQFGKLAQQATTSCFARMGDTCVLVTVTVGKMRDDLDYFPLQVEYAEKLYAGGRIKGSRWVKREGRPSDEAILTGRLIDRGIRPLFPKDYRRDVQIIITLMSVDGENSPDILSAIAVSAALHVSPIPWDGPISTIRVGHVKTEEKNSFVINPSEEENKFSELDLIVTSSKDKVMMIEAEALEFDEPTALEAIKYAKEANGKIIDFMESLRKEIGMDKETVPAPKIDDKLKQILKKDFVKQLNQLIDQKAEKEFEDRDALDAVVNEVHELHKDTYDSKVIMQAIDYMTKQMIRERILKTKKRLDGRGPEDIRPLSAEVSILPRTHGSAIFQRGDTQVLSIATLGAPRLEQMIEGPEGEEAKTYMHHYYMPPYSVGETGRVGTPSRREIGHGALAEKAIEPVLPSIKEFPYAIRVVSEVLSSNGSTSMASTCGSALALMDAGVPIKKPVAGIAMGIMSNSDEDYLILTDIMGVEDFSGEMDFKVAGTKDGITAIQLDVKNKGLTDKMIAEVLTKAKAARLKILDVMVAALDKPRQHVSKFAPKVVVISPPQDKIGEIIGPGGKNIRNLIARTETDINVADDGKVTISGLDQDKVQAAVDHIESITRELEPGEEFEGIVKKIMPFGAFVEVLPGKEGLVHVSRMGKGFVKDPNDVVKVGQTVKVKVNEIDNQGRINLAMI